MAAANVNMLYQNQWFDFDWFCQCWSR
jgi:hypothetical protein